MADTFNMSDLNINMKAPQIKNMRMIIAALILGFLLISSVYTVDANENAVVLRFGAYSNTTGPGLQFKFPFIETVEKVKVDYQYKQEFGFRTIRPGVKTQYSTRGFEKESWMLTGDLKIAEVKWVVQYKIKDAKD